MEYNRSSELINEAALFSKLMNKEYTAKNIEISDLSRIIGMYADSILDIYDLGPGQSWMLEAGKRCKSAFFLQMTLIVEMKMDIASFEKKVNDVCKKRDTLRFAYVHKNLKKPYAVELKDRKPDLTFTELSSDYSEEEILEQIERLSAADFRDGFDLEKDSLFRMTVINLNRNNQYAFIISQPHINSDGTSIGLLIKDIFIDYAMNLEMQDYSDESVYKQYQEYLARIDKSKEIKYWQNYLKGMPDDVSLPGEKTHDDVEYEQDIVFVPIKEDTMRKFNEAQKKYKATSFNIMQTAWAIALSKLKASTDIVFGAVTAGRDVEAFGGKNIPGGFVRVIPVRIRADKDSNIGSLIETVQKDFINSSDNSHCTPEEIKKALSRDKDVFTHLLNCHNFKPNTASGDILNLPGLRILSGNAYDNLSTELSIYIISQDGKTGFGFGYNKNVFSRNTVEIFASYLNEVLDQIILSDVDIKVSDINEVDSIAFIDDKRAKEEELNRIISFLSGLSHFKEVSEPDIRLLAEKSMVCTYLSADEVLSENDKIQYVPFVMEGKVITWMKNSQGWLNPVNVKSKGSSFSYAGLIADEKAGISVSVHSSYAEVLNVPASELKAIIKKYPSVVLSIIREQNETIKALQKMWVND